MTVLGARNLVIGLPRFPVGHDPNNRDYCTLQGGGYDKNARGNPNNAKYNKKLP